jgi:hypothetical protein
MGKFSAAWALKRRSFRALAGVDAVQFGQMVEQLRPLWQKRVVARKNRSGRPWSIGGLEDHLLVMLVLYRCAVTQEFLGLFYGVDKAAICRALARIGKLAARVLGVSKNIKVSCEEAEALIIDCTEQPIERPKRKQRCWYSGKKKRHTIKTEIIITEAGRVVSASDPAPGRVHDLEIRRRGPPLPKEARAYADSGYQGYQKDHPDIDIPFKKPKKKKLTKEEKAYNHALSRFRVRVEHKIAALKRFKILAERFRYPRSTYATKFATIAGIVNLIAGF